MSLIDEIAAQHEGKHQQDGSYLCKCPCHDDNHASLHLTAGDNGRILVYCHAGCSYDVLVKALGLSRENVPSQKWIEKIYPYVDADGKKRYEAIRYRLPDGGKDFRQRQGVGIWNLDGIEPLPYHLPQLLTAIQDNRTVIWVEGEKDVETLERVGYAATTNHGGANKPKTVNAIAHYLKGAKVIVLPDNDAVGLKHAEQVCAALVKANAASVLLGRVPGEAKDITEYLLLRHEDTWLKEVGQLVDNAISWTGESIPPPADDYSPIQPPDFDSIYIGNSDTTRPLMSLIKMPFCNIARLGGFATWLPSGKMTAVVSYSGGNKTTFVESFMDKLLQDGKSALLFSPEWNAIEYIWRAAQRADGPTYMESLVNEGYWAERKKGLTDKEARRRGYIPFTQDQVHYATEIAQNISRWPGKIYHLPHKADITTLLENAQKEIDYRRQQSNPISLIVIDYLQRLTTSMARSEFEQVSQILSMLGEFNTVNNLHTVIVSQVTKQGSMNIKKDGLSPDMMQNARSDLFNLVLMLQPEFTESGETTNIIQCWVGKNSQAALTHRPILLQHVDRLKLIQDYVPPAEQPIEHGAYQEQT